MRKKRTIVFNPGEVIKELLAYVDVRENKGIFPTITLSFQEATEMQARLKMLKAYIGAR